MRLLLMLVVLAASAGPSRAQGFDPFGLATIESRPGAEVPLERRFRDAAGAPTTLAAIGRGRPILLVPVLHDCPNVCGVTLAGLADAVAGQALRPGRDFAVVAFGIDPAETPAAAAADLARLRARANGRALGDVAALTGSRESVRAVTDAIGFRYAWDGRTGQYAHVAAVAVLTPDGRLSSWLYGLKPEPEALGRALAAARDGRTGNWTDRLLLLCYHYDPVSGRYTARIEMLLRIAGGLTMAAIALLIWRLSRRVR